MRADFERAVTESSCPPSCATGRALGLRESAATLVDGKDFPAVVVAHPGVGSGPVNAAGDPGARLVRCSRSRRDSTNYWMSGSIGEPSSTAHDNQGH